MPVIRVGGLVSLAVLAQLLGFFVTLAAARLLPVAAFEAYVVAAALFILLATAAPLGSEKHALRHLTALLEQADLARACGLLLFGARRSLGVALALAVGVGVWALLAGLAPVFHPSAFHVTVCPDARSDAGTYGCTGRGCRRLCGSGDGRSDHCPRYSNQPCLRRELALHIQSSDAKGIRRLLAERARWLLPAIMALLSAMFVLAGQVLSFFRPLFAQAGATPLRILAIGCATTVFFSLVPTMLKFGGQHAMLYKLLVLAAGFSCCCT